MLAFGRFRREERLALSVAAEQAAFTLHAAESPEEAGRWLESHDALAMLLDTDASESLAVQTRSSARHARLPIIALSREIGDLCFNDAFSWGADDVLPLTSTRPLLTRLRTLPRETGALPASARGTALIAETRQDAAYGRSVACCATQATRSCSPSPRKTRPASRNKTTSRSRC